MPRSISRNIRYVFVAFAGALLMLAGVQSFASSEPRMGLSSCGTDENPCVLEGITVKAEPAVAVQAPAVSEAREVAIPVQHAREVQSKPLPAQS